LSDPTAVIWLHDYGALLAATWNLGAAEPLCATLGANGGCAMDPGDILALLVADGLAAALTWGQPTAAERAAWEAVAAEAWRIGSEHPWGGYAPATFMSAKSQVLYGISGQPFMRYALAQAAARTLVVSSAIGSDAALSLTWSDAASYTAYEVWRHTTPTFAAGRPPATLIADGGPPHCASSDGTVTCTDAEALGTSDVNYFYLVRGLTTLGVWAGSNEIGVFTFDLVPGASRAGWR
jgi:hypothetical protein